MRPRAGFPLAVLALLAAAACTQRRTVCGDVSYGGGPPRIETRDAELCEAVRIRVLDHLSAVRGMAVEQAELLRDLTWRWEDVKTTDGLVRRVREDAGEEFAAAIARAIDDVRAHGSKPTRADCAEADRCLVKGAALGARIALDDAVDLLRRMRRAAAGQRPAGGPESP